MDLLFGTSQRQRVLWHCNGFWQIDLTIYVTLFTVRRCFTLVMFLDIISTACNQPDSDSYHAMVYTQNPLWRCCQRYGVCVNTY